ncbi:hypothetical protein MGN01_45020 [Methylobacterium gnaphalii]|uniref:Uncharacterized protein n=1 Tax=Methylobacterium gnaphalii TaxID=1010610 RepID=A0A512JRS2_9HYPH|nr:hypothetical protein MGN01_45020 [Methylobacterium gnaphalii]GLS51379.1 hypothetical protein GCM10007885_42360 [Methylobacterium gnaphalii]
MRKRMRTDAIVKHAPNIAKYRIVVIRYLSQPSQQPGSPIDIHRDFYAPKQATV